MDMRDEYELVYKALRQYHNISVVDMKEAFTYYDNHLIFWFQTDDCSTHIVSQYIG